MLFGEHILAYRDEMLKDLAGLVAIPSVACDPAPGFPFGRGPAKALDFMLRRAEQMGFTVKNVDNYAGHAEYGQGPEAVDVLTHLDVVPAGEGWETDPFTLTQRGNLYFGRGVGDNKGPAIAALYGLKALKDAGITGPRRIRAVFGCGEEIASNDIDTYYAAEGYPLMGFTPDCAYGICNREKGILRMRFTPRGGAPAGAVVKFSAGTVVNAVPAVADAAVRCGEEEYAALCAASEKVKGTFQIKRLADGAQIHSIGVASHGAEPSKGSNAAAHLLSLLKDVFGAKALGALPAFLCDKIGEGFDGAGVIGEALRDEPSGELTLNLGIVQIGGGEDFAKVDIRYPVTADGQKIISRIKETAACCGLDAEPSDHKAPLYLEESSPLITILKSSYEAVMQSPCEIFSTGGGTYARETGGRGVAFGAGFPDEPDRCAHNIGEHMDIEYYMRHAQICLEAMYRMFTAK